MYRLSYFARSNADQARTKKRQPSNINRHPGRGSLLLSLCCLVIIVMTLAFSRISVSAKGPSLPTYQGVIVQVDATNPSSRTFSVLDSRGGTQTFQLLTSTRFASHQSASQLSVNTRVVVQATSGKAGTLNASSVQLQGKNQAVLHVQGVVVSIDQHQKQIGLALNDGTVLGIAMNSSSIAHLQTGALLALTAKFAPSGGLVALISRVISSHTAHFQARGIVSHLNTRVHLVTLVSASGASFSLAQPASVSGSFHIGEKMIVKGSSDSHGNLSLQSTSVEDVNAQYLTVIGTVNAIDTTAGTFSLLDQDGNSATLSAAPDLLASLKVGGIYQFEVQVASDGSLTAVKILSTDGTDGGEAISVEGTVQTFDSTSNLLSIVTDNGQNYTALVNTQTEIVGCDGTAGSLAAGETIHAQLQVQPDGSYTALKVKIEECGDNGGEVNFSGFFLSYDSTSGQLIIATEDQSQVIFATNSATTVDGIQSLADVTDGTPVHVTAQVQTDGSYLATQVQVYTVQDDLHIRK